MLQRDSEPTTNIADREDVSQAADLIARAGAFETIMMMLDDSLDRTCQSDQAQHRD
jgi:hypothetical protein